VIDRSAWKEDQVLVIYKPWQHIAVDLFKQFELCDYVLSRIARYIEDRPFIFPHMSPEDAQRYMFKTRMRSVSGGYTFSSADSIRHYFSNLTLGGYAKIGRDESGNILLLANAHEAAVPMELLAPAYASITGLYPDGSRFEGKKIIVRSRTMTPEESPALLHGLLTSNDGSASFQANIVKGRPVYCCHKGVQDDGRILANKVGIMRQEKLWSVSCEELDHVVVRRLCQIAQFDANLTPRIRAYWEQRKAREVNEETILDTQIEQAEAQIIRLDQLLTNPAAPLSQDAERRYIEMRAEAEADLQRLIKKRASRKVEHDPGEFIPNFYEILAHLSQEFPRLDREHQKLVMRQVIRQIKLNQLSPHLFMLYINWQNGIATCPDVALLWRGVMPPTSFDDWSPEEDAAMRRLYSTASQLDLMQALPQRSWCRVYDRAQVLGLRREIPHRGPHAVLTIHRTVTHHDLEVAASLGHGEDQKERLREITNELAQRTIRGGLSAYWWIPLEELAYAARTDEPENQENRDLLLLSLSAVKDEWLRRGGSSCR